MRLLLLEDSVSLADEVVRRLGIEGYACDWLVDGRDALGAAAVLSYDAIILDLGLPGIGGLELLRHWRGEGFAVPILVLTARNRWSDRIEGLQAGADDYLGKPFHPDELVLRVRALLRRSHGLGNEPRLEVGGVALDEARQCAVRGGEAIDLTAGEFTLLRYFMHNPGRVLSKSQLEERLYTVDRERSSNVVEVHVSHLRGKLGREVIRTRRGQGYVFGGVK